MASIGNDKVSSNNETLHPTARPKEPTAEQRRASLHVVALQAKGLIASKDAADLHELLGVKLPDTKVDDSVFPGTIRDQRRRTAAKRFTTHIMRKTQSGTELLIKDSRKSTTQNIGTPLDSTAELAAVCQIGKRHSNTIHKA